MQCKLNQQRWSGLIRTLLQLSLSKWKKSKRRRTSPSELRFGSGQLICGPGSKQSALRRDRVYWRYRPNHAKRSGIIKPLGDPFWLVDDISVLHYGWQNLSLPRNYWQLLVYQCLLSAEWHTASTVRCSGRHLYLAAPCAALESGHADLFLHGLTLNGLSFFFQLFSEISLWCFGPVWTYDLLSRGWKFSNPQSSHWVWSPFSWVFCRSTATPGEQAEDGAVSEGGR
jgi:hypothetical protein